MSSISISKIKLQNVGMGLAYAVLYDIIYSAYIIPMWGYMVARGYAPMSIPLYLLYLVLSAFPIVFFKGINTVAALFSFFIYILVYIPFVDALLTTSYPIPMTIGYITVFFISMCVFFRSDNYVLFASLFNKKRRTIPFAVIEIITILLLLYVVMLNRGHMTWINFLTDSKLMYEARDENDISAVYFVGWLGNALLPILMIFYLKRETYIKYGLCIIAYILLYMINMQKGTFLLPFVMTGAYFLVRSLPNLYKQFHRAVLMVLIISSVTLLVISEYSTELEMVASIFFFRTLCIEGAELSTYLDFFEIAHHPFTHFSHVGGLNLLIGANPYPESIGMAVTYGKSNANGTFWLMDGIAAWGIIGCVIISAIFVFFKSAFNAVQKKCSINLCIILFLPGVMTITNASLFTSIITGGFLLLYLLFLLLDFSEFKTLINK